jgi:hypothetical protein
MIELRNNTLHFSFPEVHKRAECVIEFQRTLRIPDDNREHYLPPGLGAFPLFHVDDFAKKVPKKWLQHGGIFFPMYQAEAMWINLHGTYPFAIKIAAGKIDAVTGKGWSNQLSKKHQNYIVIPQQPWLDGFCVQKGRIRQFVAMPLGKGYTAEGQITGKEEHGGLQVIAYPMKKSVYKKLFESRREKLAMLSDHVICECATAPDMGLAPGGLMRQEIYEDEYGYDAWDREHYSRCFVHIANSEAFLDITGHAPPTKPPTAEEYTNAGFPWFDYYDADLNVLKGSPILSNLDSVAAKKIKNGEEPLEDNEPVDVEKVIEISPSKKIRDGKF